MPTRKLRGVLAGNVRKYRLKSKMTQEAMSYACGFARPYVGKIERGEISTGVDTIEIMARVLKVRADKLLRE